MSVEAPACDLALEGDGLLRGLGAGGEARDERALVDEPQQPPVPARDRDRAAVPADEHRQDLTQRRLRAHPALGAVEGARELPLVALDEPGHVLGLRDPQKATLVVNHGDVGEPGALDGGERKVSRDGSLREILPMFVGGEGEPVAVVEGDGRLAGLVYQGSLIAGLTSIPESQEEAGAFEREVPRRIEIHRTQRVERDMRGE